jgi:hypothetical protein
VIGTGGAGPRLPSHSMRRLEDSLVLEFADMDPKEQQETWGLPVPPYGRPAEQLVMDKGEHAKKIWKLLLKRRPGPFDVLVVSHDGGPDDRRAASVAAAICDTLGLARTAVFRPDRPDEKLEGPAPNGHVYATVRAGRALVVE